MLTMEDVEGNEELCITALLANHLFGRLVTKFDQPYYISNDYRSEDIYNKCPCEICGEKIIYRNLGIGSECLWYGYPDVLMFSQGSSCSPVRARDIDKHEQIARRDIYFEADFDEKQLMEERKHVDLLRQTKK